MQEIKHFQERQKINEPVPTPTKKGKNILTAKFMLGLTNNNPSSTDLSPNQWLHKPSTIFTRIRYDGQKKHHFDDGSICLSLTSFNNVSILLNGSILLRKGVLGRL
ncbi:hypothetical protein AVEN_44439-1 [Araneus ventricosus]|uniref:Uncharacterized protein n=1 Tax=Araneus ventricosus TaxID=182803 RepID=A0A4Y2QEB0_ARAVE|nr:hypothetical protein AVEN_44439-1 [Araneus ventricosus]